VTIETSMKDDTVSSVEDPGLFSHELMKPGSKPGLRPVVFTLSRKC